MSAYGLRADEVRRVACPSHDLGGCGARAGLTCFLADGVSVRKANHPARVDAYVYRRATPERLVELLSEEKVPAKLAIIRAELARRAPHDAPA